MFEFAVRTLINGIALIAAVRIVPDAAFTGDVIQLVLLAVVFGLVNSFVRPIVKLLSLPLNIVSFGLIGFVINAGLVMLAAAISDNLNLGFTLGDWPPGAIELDTLIAAFLVSIVLSVVSALAAFVRLATPGRGRF